MKKAEAFASVWDALEDDPAEIAKLKLRSELMVALEKRIDAWSLTQAEAAKRLNMTQPRLNDLLRGRFNKFSLDALITIAYAAGLSVSLSIKKAA